MRGLARKFRETGVQLVVVVQARPEQLADTVKYTRDLISIADPTRASYRAFGLHRMPAWKMLMPGEIFRSRKRATRAGFAQSWARTFAKESDVWLNPGAALMARGGRILWMHRGKHVADLPPADDLLAIAQEHATRTRSARRRG